MSRFSMQFKIDSFSFDPRAAKTTLCVRFASQVRISNIAEMITLSLDGNRIEMEKRDRWPGKECANETGETKNARGCVNDIVGMSKRLGARVI